jgi:ribosome-binding factor A
MVRNRRTERLNQLFREELAILLRDELKDPRVASVTITHVEVTQDLAYADVYIRTLTGSDEDAIEGLQSAEGFIRRRLGKELHVRRVPDFRFHVDKALEHAQRIETLLDEALGENGRDGSR